MQPTIYNVNVMCLQFRCSASCDCDDEEHERDESKACPRTSGWQRLNALSSMPWHEFVDWLKLWPDDDWPEDTEATVRDLDTEQQMGINFGLAGAGEWYGVDCTRCGRELAFACRCHCADEPAARTLGNDQFLGGQRTILLMQLHFGRAPEMAAVH